MNVLRFETVVAARTDGEVLIAFFDGSEVAPAPQTCVALLRCTAEAADALCTKIRSSLNAVES